MNFQDRYRFIMEERRKFNAIIARIHEISGGVQMDIHRPLAPVIEIVGRLRTAAGSGIFQKQKE